MTNDVMSMKDAVKMSGKSEATLRRLISISQIDAKKDKDGRYVISQESLRNYLGTKAQPTPQAVLDARKGAAARPRNEAVTAIPDGLVDERLLDAKDQLLAQVREELERERKRNENLERKVHELEVEQRAGIAELRAMLEGQTGVMRTVGRVAQAIGFKGK